MSITRAVCVKIASVFTILPVATFAALPEIVTTAQRIEGSLQEVPVAVTAIGVDELNDLQINTGQDLQRVVPSLNMFNNITSPTNLSPSLRGGLQQDASLVTAESPFGIYIDDIYVGRLNNNNVTLSDIDRVEVLRGPQGTLYGRNTGYGAIKFITRVPDDEHWYNSFLGAGTDSQLNLGASIGGPLNDSWSGSLSGQSRYKSGQYFNIAEDTEVDKRRDYAARGKLHYTGGDKLAAVLTVSYSDSENDAMPLLFGITPNVGSDSQFTTDDLVFPNGEYNVESPFDAYVPFPLRDRPQSEVDQTIVGLTVTYDINDNLQFKSITGLAQLEYYTHSDFTGDSDSPARALGASIYAASDSDTDQWSQEILLIGEQDRWNYLVGAYYLTESSEQLWGWNLGSPFAPLSTSFIDTETDSTAVFADIGYQWTDKLKVSAGARWTEDDKDFKFDYQFLLAPVPAENIMLSRKDDDVITRVVAEYAVNDDLLVYGQRSEGFKGGGFSAIALFSTDAIGSYAPEENETWEAGLKGDWFGGELRTNLAYFFSDISDIQQNSTADAGPGSTEFPVENVGDAEIQGLEFEIFWSPVESLNAFLVGSLMDGEYKDLVPGGAAFNAPALYGVIAQTPQTPDYQFSVGFDYTFEVQNAAFDSVTYGVDYYKTDDYISSATNDFLNKSWDQLNAFINIDIDENWQLSLSGKNITDEFIVVSGSRALGGFVTLPPREYLFTIRYRH